MHDQLNSISSSSLSSDSLNLESPAQEEEKTSFKRLVQSVPNQCVAAWREVASDVRSVRWSRAGLWSLFGAWVLTILGVFTYLMVYGFNSGTSTYGETTACRADNSFNINISTYNAWAASGFFEINLGAGNLTFTQAKVVDISWDIIIGRGGQAVLAFVSWRAFIDYVTTSMEFAPITYTVFSTIYLQDEPSVFSTFRLTQIFISGRGLRSRLSMVFMISTMLFLIGWPTFAGAMTGYTTIVKAFVPDYNGNYIPYSDFRPVAYVIHDGPRINLTEDHAVPFSGRKADGAEPLLYSTTDFTGTCDAHDFGVGDCDLQRNTSNYVSSNGFFGLRNTTSVWSNVTLPGPVLNISAFYFDSGSQFFGLDWADPRAKEPRYPFRDPSNITLAYSDETYPLTYVQAHGRCQAVQDRFKWGFSFLQIFIMIVLLNIWTVGIYLMWLKARFQLPSGEEAEVPRGWKPILVLAEKIKEELREAEIDVRSLTNKQLEKTVTDRLQGGSVSFNTPLARRGYSFRQGTKKWLKGNRSWFLTMVLTLILLMGVWIISLYFGDPTFSLFLQVPCIFIGMLFGSTVGSTIRSSLLIVLCWTVPGFVITFATRRVFI